MNDVIEVPQGSLLPVFPGTISLTGLAITGKLEYSCWEEILQRLMLMNECSAWWLGDALLYGEKSYGEMYSQAVEVTGRAYQTLANYVFVCRAIPADQRRDDLSFTHHSEVASVKDPSERAEWLSKAAENDWSVSALRKARQEVREATEPAPAPSPADNALVSSESLIEAVKAADIGTKLQIARLLIVDDPHEGQRDWSRQEADDDNDASDPFSDSLPQDNWVLECDLPGCLMSGPHFRSECHTVEMLEAQESEFRIYLASRYSRREELADYRAQLEAHGLAVTSRWLNGGHEFDAKDAREEFKAEERARFAAEDWADLMSASICISFTEPKDSKASRGGRHVEFGAALASGKRCMVVGPAENVFHCLPEIERFETWQECLEALSVREEVTA